MVSHSIAEPVLDTDYFCEFGSPPDSDGVHYKAQFKQSILEEFDRKRKALEKVPPSPVFEICHTNHT